MSFEDLRNIARGKLTKPKEEEEEQTENKSDNDSDSASSGPGEQQHTTSASTGNIESKQEGPSTDGFDIDLIENSPVEEDSEIIKTQTVDAVDDEIKVLII